MNYWKKQQHQHEMAGKEAGSTYINSWSQLYSHCTKSKASFTSLHDYCTNCNVFCCHVYSEDVTLRQVLRKQRHIWEGKECRKGTHAELSQPAKLKYEWKGSISHANSLKQKPCLAIVSTRNRASSLPQVFLWQILINFKNLWSL